MLQIAGTSLDIGAKIYSLRVDDLHGDILKLANSLIRFNTNENQNGNDEQDENEENGENGDAPIEQVKKKKRQRNLNAERVTVSKQEDNLNSAIIKHPGLFGQCSESTDSSTMMNIALSKGPGCSYELLVRSRSKLCPWQVMEREAGIRDGPAYGKDLLEDVVLSSAICPAFGGFTIDKWDVNEEEDLEQMHDEVRLSFIYTVLCISLNSQCILIKIAY